MKVIGITGGVGSGKSLALKHLADKPGIVVYEADKIAHELQRKGTTCFEKIIDVFGTGILDSQGEIDRKALGMIVFKDSSVLVQLNNIVHPEVRVRVEKLIQEHESNQTKIFVLEAALLLEGDYQTICDEVWYIYCDEAIRMKRLAESRNYTIHTFEQIKAKQLPEREFLKRCHVTIHNSTTEENLYKALNAELERL